MMALFETMVVTSVPIEVKSIRTCRAKHNYDPLVDTVHTIYSGCGDHSNAHRHTRILPRSEAVNY